MDITINKIDNTKYKKNFTPTFKGPLDGAITSVLRTLDTNEMANAVILDLGTMVAPRTYFDTKDRNKYAGGETFIREISGTFINCLAAGFLGGLIAKFATKFIDKNIKLNPNTWFSNDSINVLKSAWDDSGNKTEKFVENVLNGINAKDGNTATEFKNINWNNIEWFEEKQWGKYHWNNPAYSNLIRETKTKNGIVNNLAKLINDKDVTKHDKKQAFNIIETRITNALKANCHLNVEINKSKLQTNLTNLIRDIYDMGNNVFTNKNVNIDSALKKIKKVNNAKIFGALTLASGLGISMQYLNRKITEKRTGKKGFVGEVDYEKTNSTKQTKGKGFFVKKLIASAGMAAMVLGVMRVKNPKDFVKKLQFTGPVSTGNAIKTVYMATIIGRILASESNNELRETVVRDYLGFLNWLVLGGFAAKGVANILDPKKQNLFNIHKEGKGIKHWLNDITLKTHAEIAAHGSDFARQNIKKLNIAHAAGLAYSTIMLGILLPKLNTKMTEHNSEKNKQINKVA